MKFAMVFPGQGSQSVGMLEPYAGGAEVDALVQRASEILNQDLRQLLTQGSAEDLGRTTNTQPIMLIAGYAAFRVWKMLGGPDPDLVAGHSLGEYTALVVAGAIDFEECLPLVRARAQAMQEAVPEGKGAMAAILGLDDAAVREVCAEAAQREVVEPVNFNAPSQVVIAGHRAAVERAAAAAKSKGAKRAVTLPVSAPFHSSLMEPASKRLAERLESVTIRRPHIPVIHNVDVSRHTDSESIRGALIAQAARPVRWVETMRTVADDGVTLVGECGPGKVLAPLAKRCDERLTGVAMVDRASMEKALAQLRGLS